MLFDDCTVIEDGMHWRLQRIIGRFADRQPIRRSSLRQQVLVRPHFRRLHTRLQRRPQKCSRPDGFRESTPLALLTEGQRQSVRAQSVSGTSGADGAAVGADPLAALVWAGRKARPE